MNTSVRFIFELIKSKGMDCKKESCLGSMTILQNLPKHLPVICKKHLVWDILDNIHIMACRLFGGWPLLEVVLIRLIDLYSEIFIEIKQKTLKKSQLNCRLSFNCKFRKFHYGLNAIRWFRIALMHCFRPRLYFLRISETTHIWAIKIRRYLRLHYSNLIRCIENRANNTRNYEW